jgi:hypothetical protein
MQINQNLMHSPLHEIWEAWRQNKREHVQMQLKPKKKFKHIDISLF